MTPNMMPHAAIAGLLLPLLGFLILMISSYSISRRLAGVIACVSVSLSFVCFVSLLLDYAIGNASPQNITLFTWIPIPNIDANFTLHIDQLAIVMALVITGVGSLIHIYSIGYMDHESDYARYFACLNFFIFSMLLLVLAEHLLLLFVGWEGVGLASYLLIGFWYTRPAAAQAATKAFVMNRIGDLGLLIGIILTFYLFETGNISEISSLAGQKFAVGAPIIALLTVLYFIGAIGKSAQMPLHTWLPDAMEGPTPVSALIHAATMVTAGVYLVVRMHSVFILAPVTLQIVGVIGGITSLFAAICAIGQTDLKRVLAYSTISQLGLMFLACGAGAFYAAIFHLVMHAFVKGSLFLSAGNVVHMMKGETDMRKMGGLSKIFRSTHWLFLIGSLSLAGIPPFAAFFSKELILEQEFIIGYEKLFYIGLATSTLTGFYLIRAYCLTFTGQSRDNTALEGTKEAPKIMLIPVMILAVLSIFGGFLGFEFGITPPLERFLKDLHEVTSVGLHLSPETLVAIAGAFCGVAIALLLYTKKAQAIHPAALLKNAFYIDKAYHFCIVRPLKLLSKLTANFLEPALFDQSINIPVLASQKSAQWLQKFQSGQIRSYAAWMVAATAFFIVYFVF